MKPHHWIVIGEDTHDMIYWCQCCGCLGAVAEDGKTILETSTPDGPSLADCIVIGRK